MKHPGEQARMQENWGKEREEASVTRCALLQIWNQTEREWDCECEYKCGWQNMCDCVCVCSTTPNCCAWLSMLWCPFLLLLSQLLSFASGFRPVYCLVFGRSIHVIACFSFDSFTLFWAEKKISLDFFFFLLLKFNSPFRYAVNMFLTHYTGCISSPVTISFMEKQRMRAKKKKHPTRTSVIQCCYSHRLNAIAWHFKQFCVNISLSLKHEKPMQTPTKIECAGTCTH